MSSARKASQKAQEANAAILQKSSRGRKPKSMNMPTRNSASSDQPVDQTPIIAAPAARNIGEGI